MANKFAVIGYPSSYNLGDEIQSIAAARLLPSVDMYLPREGLNKVDTKDRVKLLCNGFFMDEPANWPPSNSILPLFISLHVTGQKSADKIMLQPHLKAYYDQFAPIGCRDKRTLALFQKLGVDAYFSACVTLTLPPLFTEAERTDDILLVDPFYKYQSKDYRNYLEEKIIPKKYHDQVYRLTHALPKDHTYTESDKIALAEKLLARYARAKLVVTSRIHCALPCLAMGTPVIFINTGYDRKHGMERFDGLLPFFHTVGRDHFPLPSRKPLFKILRALKIHRLVNVAPLPVDFDQPSPNKDLHKPYAAAIRERVGNWLLKA